MATEQAEQLALFDVVPGSCWYDTWEQTMTVPHWHYRYLYIDHESARRYTFREEPPPIQGWPPEPYWPVAQ